MQVPLKPVLFLRAKDYRIGEHNLAEMADRP